jgi:hypothetical protein
VIRTDGRRGAGLVVLALMGMSGSIQAQMPEWRTVTADELAMTSEPKAPEAQAIILYMHVVRDDRSNNENRYQQIKILTEEGRSNADIVISFDHKREYLREIEARTIRKDGTIVPYTGVIFEKPIASGSDLKLMAKTLALTDVEVGSVVEYRYSRRTREGRYNVRWLLGNRLFTREARYSFRGNGSYRYGAPRGLPPGTAPIAEAKGGYVELYTRDVAALVDEEFSPPAGEAQQRLDFTYAWDGDRPADDPEKFWKRYSMEQRHVTEKYLLSSGALRSVIQDLAPAGEPPAVRLRKLYEACAAIRNKSYEPERSDEEAEREDESSPISARDVWKRQYGWAYQINLLFLAMAREAGFDAAEMWVADRSDTFFDPKQMDPGQLSTRLVVVKLDGRNLFLSPGTKFLPFGELAWARTAQSGLRIDRNSNSWVPIPSLTPAQSRSVYTARLTLSPDGVLKGKVVETQTGQEALWRRNRENNEDDAHRRKFLEDELIGKLGGSAIAHVVKDPDWSGTGDFVTEYDLTIKDGVLQAGDRRMFPQAFFVADTNKAFQGSIRLQPVYIWYPYETEEEVEIELPSGWKVGNLPDNEFQNLKRVFYSIQAHKNVGATEAVITKRKFRMDMLLLPPDGYEAIRQFYQDVRAGDEQQIVVSSGGNQ